MSSRNYLMVREGHPSPAPLTVQKMSISVKWKDNTSAETGINFILCNETTMVTLTLVLQYVHSCSHCTEPLGVQNFTSFNVPDIRSHENFVARQKILPKCCLNWLASAIPFPDLAKLRGSDHLVNRNIYENALLM